MSVLGMVLLPLGGVSMGARAWRVVRENGVLGPLHATVVLKVTLEVDDEGHARMTEPAAVIDDPTSAEHDLVPHLGKAEIWLAGRSEGLRIGGESARLSVGRGTWVMMERRVGKGSSVDPARTASGHEDPDTFTGGRAHEVLEALWRSSERAPLETDEDDVALIAADADWTQFFAVPAEQRCRYLQGDEWVIAVAGAHKLRCQLPQLRGGARVFGPDLPERGQEIDMVCDGLEVDLFRRRCSVRWRGALPVADLSVLADMRIAGAVSVGEDAFDWSAVRGDAEPVTQRIKRAVDQGGEEAPLDSVRAAFEEALPSEALDTAMSSSARGLRAQMGVPRPRSGSSARDAAARLAMSDSDAELVRAKLGIPAGKAGAAAVPKSPGQSSPAVPAPVAEGAKKSAPPPADKSPDKRSAPTVVQVGGADAGRTRPQGGIAVGSQTAVGIGGPAPKGESTDRDPSES